MGQPGHVPRTQPHKFRRQSQLEQPSQKAWDIWKEMICKVWYESIPITQLAMFTSASMMLLL